ncbi:MAG TPA: FHA domain-containing protein [Thermoanaerobaculia bacterium]|nr:FHA domain-containing protein [Thermoanaerobaculia bacterium]
MVVLRAGQVLAKHELPPASELVLGRTPQCQVTIADNTVSRMHARIYADGQAVYLEDLGSANGTFIDGERIVGTVRLADGQLVRPGQKALPAPIVLRFEDPAQRQGAAGGLVATARIAVEPPPPPPPPPSRMPTPLAVPPPPPPKVVPTVTATSVTVAPAPPPPPAAAQGAVARPRPPASVLETRPIATRQPPRGLLLAAAVALLVLLGAGAFWWRSTLPAPTRWGSAQLASQEVSPGGTLILEGTEIEPDVPLVVRVAGRDVAGVEVTPGRLRIPVLPLPGRPAGRYSVPLSVHRGDEEVFATEVSYVVRPRVDHVAPLRAMVGDTLTIEGSALPESPADVVVTIGSMRARVVQATASRLLVRVPRVTTDQPAALSLAVRVGDWQARPAVVEISPRPQHPVEFNVRAEWHPEQKIWELSSPLGALFLFHAEPPAADGSAPARVQQAQQQIHDLFTAAADDPDLRVTVTPARRAYRFVVTSPQHHGAPPFVELSEADLVATARSRRLDTAPDVLALWMARVWNHLLDAFARGEKPPAATTPSYLPVVARLVAANLDAGGSGTPEAADLERLPAPDRQALADAFVAVPAGYGNVAGHWIARLENVFYPEDQYLIELTLDLDQKGRSLSGHGVVLLQGSAMTLKVPSAPAGGALRPGAPPTVTIHLSMNRPIGDIELAGSFEGSALVGTFRSSTVKRTGTWQAIRQ